jgi:hypothetical protein
MYKYFYYIPKKNNIHRRKKKNYRLFQTPRSHNCVFWLHGVSIGLKNCVSFRGHTARIPLEYNDNKEDFISSILTYSHRTSPIQSWLALSLWHIWVDVWNVHWSEQHGPLDGLNYN